MPLPVVVGTENGWYAVCQWAPTIQECNFQIVYWKGSLNANADALSRLQTSSFATTVVMPHHSATELHTAQLRDSTISKIYRAHLQSSTPPHGQGWNHHPLKQYWQLWAQLQIVHGVLCRQCTPTPTSRAVTVPILPSSLH